MNVADNVLLNSGSGGATLAADEISSVHYQRVKVSHGADGSATDTSASNPLPVLLPKTTIYRNLDVDESEDEVASSAVEVYWINISNLSNGVLYLKLYNAAAANVTVGTTTPVMTIPLPTSGNTNGIVTTIETGNAIEFDTGLTVAATTGIADANTGAPGANEVVLNLGYRTT